MMQPKKNGVNALNKPRHSIKQLKMWRMAQEIKSL